MSVVMRCQTADGTPAVLKVCPDRDRIAHEAAALANWEPVHVPAVFAVDTDLGALLIEAIVPGTTFLELPTFPAAEVAELLRSLHAVDVPGRPYPLLARRVSYLFDSWARHREQQPELLEVVPPELFEEGRRWASLLAAQSSPVVVLHGDLTPVNVLRGAGHRGLVAIDPAPCLGDPAFDAVDLLFCQAGDVATIEDRADRLAPTIGVTPTRLLDWCVAFAGMTASELVSEGTTSDERVRTALALAAGNAP